MRYIYNIYPVFIWNFSILQFIKAFLGGQKNFISEIWDNYFEKPFFPRILAFFVCILLNYLIGVFLTFIVLWPKMAWHWTTKIGITQTVFDKIVQNFARQRKIDVQKGMPSFASISATIRRLFMKNRGGRIRPFPPPPPRRSRVGIPYTFLWPIIGNKHAFQRWCNQFWHDRIERSSIKILAVRNADISCTLSQGWRSL